MMTGPHHLGFLGGALLLGGCLQRSTPETEAPVSSFVRSFDAGLPDAGRVAPCDERLRSNPPWDRMPDGGVPRPVLTGLGADGGLGGDGGGATALMGALDKELIRETIVANKGSVISCYNSVVALKSPNSLRGKIAVRFVISATGDVCATELSQSTVSHPVLERCVLDAVASWRFPPPKGGGIVIVTYPFIFRPAEARDGGGRAPADAGPEEGSLEPGR